MREIDPNSEAEIRLVAERMRLTLIEVLGEERGGSMYSMEWLVDRVRFHLDLERCRGAVFLAESGGGAVIGHTILRVEPEEPEGTGLFTTIYVESDFRKLRVASSLLACGEEWFREQRLVRAVTYTDTNNVRLIGLFQKHGYELTAMPNDFVALSRFL